MLPTRSLITLQLIPYISLRLVKHVFVFSERMNFLYVDTLLLKYKESGKIRHTSNALTA